MNIGFVSTWFERGAAYVTRAYLEALEDEHNVFVYARGGEVYKPNTEKWNEDYVTWGLRLGGTRINWKHFKKWIERNKLDLIFFNEQADFYVVAKLKECMPDIITGSYIDYYKRDTIKKFDLFDFLICNTKRHYSAFSEHKQVFLLPWGTNTDLYKVDRTNRKDKVTFFHSVGMSRRKGISKIVSVFIDNKLGERANLVVHTQIPISTAVPYTASELKEYGIEVIEKTVTAPGLYHMGDIYVYPTEIDGLGLTIYEALSCGMPVITTDVGPLNEIVDENLGALVEVERSIGREDGYYWPLSIINKDSLLKCMLKYIDNPELLKKHSENARKYAEENLNWNDRKNEIKKIFEAAKPLEHDEKLINNVLKQTKAIKKSMFIRSLLAYLPDRLAHWLANK